jgi:hypothetical protein
MLLVSSLFFSNAFATETLPEKAGAAKDDVKRDAHKSMHRVDEATCTGTDAECAKQKAGNRAEEAKDYVKDKSSEIKNKVD